MSWHPKRRDILLVLTCLVIFGLFLQLDVAGSSPSGSRGKSSIFSFGGLGRKQTFEKGAQRVHYAPDRNTVSQPKLKWGDRTAPHTKIVSHAPGWTIFEDVYLFNGTWFIVTDNPSDVPLIRLMASTGAEVWNDEGSIKSREPTDKDMRIIFPSEAKKLWGNSASRVSGTTFLCNDPPQFLDHYYHFAAEFFFGMWRTYSSLDPGINAAGETSLPAPQRIMFPHTAAGRWNDYAKMNSFIMRAVFPALSYEYESDFNDRKDTERAYIYDRVIFADRAAAFRGPEFGKTWRTSSEAATLPGSRYWWAPVRRNLIEFVGGKHGSALNLQEFGVELDQEYLDTDALQEMGIEVEAPSSQKSKVDRRAIVSAEQLKGIRAVEPAALERRKSAPSNPVITYVSRQDWGRRMLKPEDHDVLVKELRELEKKYGWEVNIVSMDKLSRDEQIRLAARTTIMMGVHGNGLTHLLWMNNLNPRATVMEFFIPGGFAEDYEYTARALGVRHYGWWGDHSFTYPNIPPVEYPEGFQGNSIPLDGKAVAQLCEQRLVVDRVTDKQDQRRGDGDREQ